MVDEPLCAHTMRHFMHVFINFTSLIGMIDDIYTMSAPAFIQVHMGHHGCDRSTKML